MLLIAITGGIGSGKTYVAKIFEQLNVPAIYADNIVKELLSTDQNIISQIEKYFNIKDLQKNFNIKNIKMQIFKNKKHRLFLENLIHPKVIEKIIFKIKDLECNNSNHQIRAYCIIEIPMLQNIIKILKTININKIILVNCDQNLQISRIMHRDKLSKSQVISIIKSQGSIKNIHHLVDHILDGNELKNLYQQVINLHEQFL